MAESYIRSIYSATIFESDEEEIADIQENKCPKCDLREICSQMNDGGIALVKSPNNVEAALNQAACRPTQQN